VSSIRTSASKTPVWQRAIGDFPSLLHLVPQAVRPEDSLDAVVTALGRNPEARSVFVVDEDDHLLGVISEQRLDADLIKLVLPQPMWASMGELSPRQLLLAAKGKAQTAKDLMLRCSAVDPNTPLKDVLLDMFRDHEPIRALVDEEHRLLGYLIMFEILAELLHQSAV